MEGLMEKDNPPTKEEPAKKAEQPLHAQHEKKIELQEADYKKLQEELSQAKDKYVRLYAEFENVRKRMEREKQEFIKYANEELIVEFLEILDNLERSIQAALTKHEDYAAFLKGIEIVMGHIHDLLKKNGVRVIECKGKKFDPHCHEVLLQEETDQGDDGMVIEELQKGYMLEDKVIRTAKVKVSKKK